MVVPTCNPNAHIIWYYFSFCYCCYDSMVVVEVVVGVVGES